MKRNILMTVDYQGSFASPAGELYVPDAEKIQQQIQKNIDDAMFDIRIVSFDTHDVSEYQDSPESNMFPIHCEFGTDGWKLFNIKMPTQDYFDDFVNKAIHYEAPFSSFQKENDLYFTKNKFDIWDGNQEFNRFVKTMLNKEEDSIYIQGVATNYCVFLNAMGFIERGFKVFILSDAVKAIPDESMMANERLLRNNGVSFISNSKLPTFENYVNKFKFLHTPTSAEANVVIENIRELVSKYVKENYLKSLVLGVSGGLDSAVVAALCQEKYTGVPLIGISIPISSSTEHMEQAQWVGKSYCSVFQEYTAWDDGGLHQHIFAQLEKTNLLAETAGFKSKDFPKSVLAGNMKARLRMITLYDLARKTNGMVLSTDNLSESFVGFWTLNGDVGDFGPIQNLGKGFELPKIAEMLGIRTDIIAQPPSDGLMVTEDNTDEAQLGANYQEIDAIMFKVAMIKDIGSELRREFSLLKDPKIEKIVQRFHSMDYKRRGTVNLSREEIFNLN